MRFEAASGGIHHTVETTVNNGRGTDEGVHLTDYVAGFDGKDQVIHGSALDTVALKRVSARVVERTGKVRGEVVETQTWTMSPDQRTLTVTTSGVGDGEPYHRVEVFDKER